MFRIKATIKENLRYFDKKLQKENKLHVRIS